jgi:hypothetical protein
VNHNEEPYNFIYLLHIFFIIIFNFDEYEECSKNQLNNLNSFNLNKVKFDESKLKVEINMNETMTKDSKIRSLVKQCFKEYDISDANSVMAQPNLSHNDDTDQTVHSNHDGNTIIIPITESPVNQGANQILISEVEHSPADPRIVKLFNEQ